MADRNRVTFLSDLLFYISTRCPPQSHKVPRAPFWLGDPRLGGLSMPFDLSINFYSFIPTWKLRKIRILSFKRASFSWYLIIQTDNNFLIHEFLFTVNYLVFSHFSFLFFFVLFEKGRIEMPPNAQQMRRSPKYLGHIFKLCFMRVERA